MSKHTPTPWEFIPNASDEDWQEYWCINGPENEPLFGSREYYPWVSTKEDAAFIVKAVNAYENHLNILRQLIMTVEVGRTMGLSIEIHWNVYKQAKEAIEKVEEE